MARAPEAAAAAAARLPLKGCEFYKKASVEGIGEKLTVTFAHNKKRHRNGTIDGSSRGSRR